MNLLTLYALSFVGIPYRYGGNSPMAGLDCSGVVCELLRAGGVINKDMSAQQLYDHLLIYGASANPGPGAIAFFGKSDEDISHVGFCINRDLMIEAAGGDETTLTLDDAVKKNAFVKISPVTRRRDLVGTLMPAYRLSLFGG